MRQHEDAGQEARVQAALDLTRALNGHLTCLDVVQVPALVGAYHAQGVRLEREREVANRAALQARLALEDVSWNWVAVAGDTATSIIDAASLADLIVLNRKLDAVARPDMREIAGKVLMRARKPVAAVPDGLRHFEANGRALIAWNGQPSVIATMRDCIPLLRLASSVHIFMVKDGTEGSEAEEGAIYLSRHGIRAGVRVVVDGLHSPSTLIARECNEWRADYCLMGAYDHGRIIESFGGVTKQLLCSSEIPLILGH